MDWQPWDRAVCSGIAKTPTRIDLVSGTPPPLESVRSGRSWGIAISKAPLIIFQSWLQLPARLAGCLRVQLARPQSSSSARQFKFRETRLLPNDHSARLPPGKVRFDRVGVFKAGDLRMGEAWRGTDY